MERDLNVEKKTIETNLKVSVYWFCLVQKDLCSDLIKQGPSPFWTEYLGIPENVLNEVRATLTAKSDLFDAVREVILPEGNHSWVPCPRPPCPNPLLQRIVTDILRAYGAGASWLTSSGAKPV